MAVKAPRRYIVKPSGLKSPNSIMYALNHLVLLTKFINTKSFICAASETSSRNSQPIVVILFLHKDLHSHRRLEHHSLLRPSIHAIFVCLLRKLGIVSAISIACLSINHIQVVRVVCYLPWVVNLLHSCQEYHDMLS